MIIKAIKELNKEFLYLLKYSFKLYVKHVCKLFSLHNNNLLNNCDKLSASNFRTVLSFFGNNSKLNTIHVVKWQQKWKIILDAFQTGNYVRRITLTSNRHRGTR